MLYFKAILLTALFYSRIIIVLLDYIMCQEKIFPQVFDKKIGALRGPYNFELFLIYFIKTSFSMAIYVPACSLYIYMPVGSSSPASFLPSHCAR